MNFEWSKFSYFDTSADSLNVQNEFGSWAISGKGTAGIVDMVLLFVSFISTVIPVTNNGTN